MSRHIACLMGVVACVCSVTAGASAQEQPQTADDPSQQIQLAPPRSYEPVPVKPAGPFNDPGFEAFRRQLADVVRRRDRAALQKMVVTSGFFWESENGDKTDNNRSSVENFAAAIGLRENDDRGWDLLGAAAEEATAEPIEDRKDVVCGPASPQFDEAAFESLIKTTETDPEEWGYPLSTGLEVRAAARANAPVIETLGMNLVRVFPETPVDDKPPTMLRVVGPSGKVGYVPLLSLAPVVFDQLCYVKQNGGWKITGYAGGD